MWWKSIFKWCLCFPPFLRRMHWILCRTPHTQPSSRTGKIMKRRSKMGAHIGGEEAAAKQRPRPHPGCSEAGAQAPPRLGQLLPYTSWLLRCRSEDQCYQTLGLPLSWLFMRIQNSRFLCFLKARKRHTNHIRQVRGASLVFKQQNPNPPQFLTRRIETSILAAW